MISECSQCKAPLGKLDVQCPQCGAIHFENTASEDSALEDSAPAEKSVKGDEPPKTKPPEPEPPPVDDKKFVTPIPQPEPVASPPLPPPPPPPQAQQPYGSQSYSMPDFAVLSHEAKTLRHEIDRLSISKEAIAFEAANSVHQKMKARVFFLTATIIWTLLIAGICSFLVFKIYTGTADFLNETVETRIAGENFEGTIKDVLQTKSQSILENSIEPSVIEFKEQTKNLSSELEALRAQFDDKYAELSKEVTVMDARRKMMSLAERALSGSRKSYGELLRYQNQKEYPELRELASKYVHETIAFYKSTNRVSDFSLNYVGESGEGLIDSAIPTDILISKLLNSPHWKERSKAAELLGERVESPVPEALLRAAKKDSFLDVIKASLQSFGTVTGYHVVDILDVEPAMIWWEENRPPGS